MGNPHSRIQLLKQQGFSTIVDKALAGMCGVDVSVRNPLTIPVITKDNQEFQEDDSEDNC